MIGTKAKYVVCALLLQGTGFTCASDATTAKGFVGALQSVLRHNPTVRSKQAELEEAGFSVKIAQAGRYPTLSVQADNLGQEIEEQGSFQVQQPLFAFGKIELGIEESRADYTAEQWALRKVQREYLELTAVAYAEIWGIRERLRYSDLNIQEQQSLYERIKRRESGQLASEADVRFARSRLIQARSLHQRLEGDLQIGMTELMSLTQVPVMTDNPVEASFVLVPDDFERLALRNSADIAEQRERIKVVALGVRKEKIDAMPTIYLRAQQDFLDTPEGTDETRVGVAIIGQLEGMGFSRRGRIDSASARFDAANEELRVAIEETRRRVSVLAINRKTSVGQINLQKEAIQAVSETLDSFVRQYETGRKSWVDVMNTQRELTFLRFDLAQMENDYLIQSLRLVALTGGLDAIAGLEPL